MKIKLNNVTNIQLDWLVAQCEGHKVYMGHHFLRERHEFLKERGLLSSAADLAFHLAYQDNDPIIGNVETGATKYLPQYTLDWSLAGPIIEREGIVLLCSPDKSRWDARMSSHQSRALRKEPSVYVSGPTPLIAAMRCYVASKLGEEVEVPV